MTANPPARPDRVGPVVGRRQDSPARPSPVGPHQPDPPLRRGRPRGFDRDAALDVAMRLFWRRGFDGVSVADLTAEMGISTPSLYAAFGDKRRLFWEVVARYVEGPGAFFEQAMANEMTVRRGVDRALHAAATQYTATSQPPGCLVISAGVNCALGSVDVERELRLRRRANQRALARRIAADVKSGLLPVETDSRRLAVLVGAILQGMSQQARDGATEADLHAVADAAMLAWPTEMRAG